jgi:hypothetical protein
MRLVYSLNLDKRFLIQPRLVDTKFAEPDFEQPHFNKIFFDVDHILKGFSPHLHANLVIELQIVEPNKPEGFASLGWCIFNVFDENLRLK